MIGVAIRGNTASEALAMIEQAEQLGIHAAWMTTGGARLTARSPSTSTRMVGWETRTWRRSSRSDACSCTRR